MPSIMDGIPKSEEELVKAFELAGKMVPVAKTLVPVGEASEWAFQKLKEGWTLADLRGITKEERDALLVIGLRKLQMGDTLGARMDLMQLHQLEPSDERVLFAIATSWQLEGNFMSAGKVWVYFLAADATNPEGYLRLGECFQANGEIEDARACFESALTFFDRGRPGPNFKAEAERKLAALPRLNA